MSQLLSRAAKALCCLALLAIAHAAQAERLPRVLVLGDSNSWGWIASPQGFPAQRLNDAARWPGVLGAALAGQATVLVDGLSGRTVDVDYPKPLVGLPGALFNGSRSLPEALARETPLDLLIVMLGTNDLRSDLGRTPDAIAHGLRTLVEQARRFGHGVATPYAPPAVLVVVPPPLGDVSRTPLRAFFAGMEAKSRALAPAVQRALTGTPIFDAAETTGPLAGIDGVHLSAAQHAMLGQALAPAVRRALILPTAQETAR
ncbi:GDSL-type esterase/lipase family protein [Zoogloeaceae bacterium G21618-S1]|nr:GDSL-type esterase/lipase family protein [Zoogloeaceae bacterium G21618-S1]